jgi:hypothetical protein
MKIELSEHFDEWTRLLQLELAQILEPLGREAGNYGFALAVPEDAGSACIMYAVGNESKLVGEEPGSVVWLDRRYSAVEWVQNWLPMNRSTDALQDIVAEFESRASSGSLSESELAAAHDHFISDCATAWMNAMLRCDSEGLFGHIWYKVLFMSDSEHAVLAEAFRKLNSGRALKEAAPLFDFG